MVSVRVTFKDNMASYILRSYELCKVVWTAQPWLQILPYIMFTDETEVTQLNHVSLRDFDTSIQLEFSGEWITTVFRDCVCFKTVMWLQHDIIPPQSRREAVVFYKKLGSKMDKKGWTIGLSHTASWLELIRFPSVDCIKLKSVSLW